MALRRPASVLFLSILASACAPTAPEVVRPAGSPTFAPTQFVDMLETAPARPYQEIGVIEAGGEPGLLRSQVIAQVLQKARQLGAEAVILQDVSRPAPTSTRLNPTTGTYETTGGQLVPAFKAIAIRYR